MNVSGYFAIKRLAEKEHQRELVSKWYLSVPGISKEEKRVIENSLSYHVQSHLLIFMAFLFLGSLIWFFGMGAFDPFEKIAGMPLMGKRQCTAVVEDDGKVRFKSPNTLVHETHSLQQLGLEYYELAAGDRIHIYWEKDKKEFSDEKYHILYAMPKKEADRIEGLYFAILGIGYFLIILFGIFTFFANRKKYIGWYTDFYMRMEKFCSLYHVHEQFTDLTTVEAFMAYGNRTKPSFAYAFSKIQLDTGDKRNRKRTIIKAQIVAVTVMTGIVLLIALSTSISFSKEEKANSIRMQKMMEQFKNAEAGTLKPLGEQSEYYNAGDMILQARESFPGEDVFYHISATEKYVAVVITTQEKRNVYLDRYIPVDGEVGGEHTNYKLDISMVSDAMLPEDILKNAKGYW